jgi:transcription initiation factor TFIID subunit 1, fungi type
MPLHDRTFDLVLLSNWEDQIIYEPDPFFAKPVTADNNLTTPSNNVLESGAWTQSIIWSPDAPFREFTQMEFNNADDIPEERTGQSPRT